MPVEPCPTGCQFNLIASGGSASIVNARGVAVDSNAGTYVDFVNNRDNPLVIVQLARGAGGVCRLQQIELLDGTASKFIVYNPGTIDNFSFLYATNRAEYLGQTANPLTCRSLLGGLSCFRDDVVTESLLIINGNELYLQTAGSVSFAVVTLVPV